ncbi:hypothetical protein ABPG75_005195 [Micractinium tetrahymenae]
MLAATAAQCSALARPACTARPARGGRRGGLVLCQANQTKEKSPLLGELGPIGLTVGKDVNLDEPAAPAEKKAKKGKEGAAQAANSLMDKAGVSLGPIGLTIGSELKSVSLDAEDGAGPSSSGSGEGQLQSYASLTTEEWRELYEKDGCVDLWVQEEFNSGSRLVGGSAVYRGGTAGFLSGEGPGLPSATRHKVKIINHFAEEEFEVEVPEDRYVLWAAEEEGYDLPYACRLGCCTACTVKVVQGEMYQPHSLGLSKNLRDQGYALMCVSMPLTDVVLETVPEDEAYELQFGRVFAEQATDPNSPNVERDDFAIELALLDE